MARSYDFNGMVPRDRAYSSLTVQCENICSREGQVPRDAICNRAYVEGVLNTCRRQAPDSRATDPQWDASRQAAMRIYNAWIEQCAADNTTWDSNGDEDDVTGFRAMFSKTLPHDPNGLVIPSAYAVFRTALDTRDISLFSTVPTGSLSPNIFLVEPLAGLTLNPVGPSPSAFAVPPCPSISSREAAGEMVENYCHVLCRDVGFSDYETSGIIIAAISFLAVLPGYASVTWSTIFRGVGAGDTVGPYLSQFFWLDCPYWPTTISAQVLFPRSIRMNDRMQTSATYLSCVNGAFTELDPSLELLPSYMSCARDLAHCVWKDLPGQLGERAIRIALAQGAPFSPVNPYIASGLLSNQSPFPTWAITDVCACLHGAGQVALTCAWYAKWYVNRRLRPEAFANEVEQWRLTSNNPTGIHTDLLSSEVLDAFITRPAATYYLPQTYPEGSPAHPSYPSGHATFAGCCVTILKAFLDETFIFPNPVESNYLGSALDPYVGPDLVLGHELNKMASNIAIGRDWAGVHYRSDATQGILLGERVGIAYLQEWINRYPEPDARFSFHGYLGDPITITPQAPFGTDIQNAGTLLKLAVPGCCG